MSANDRTENMAPHYVNDDAEQHWDRAWKLYREAWFVLNITKYVERYRGKGGLQDLRKARHYLDKLIELEEGRAAAETGSGTEDAYAACATARERVKNGLDPKTGAPLKPNPQSHTSHQWKDPDKAQTRCVNCGAYRHLGSGILPCENDRRGDAMPERWDDPNVKPADRSGN